MANVSDSLNGLLRVDGALSAALADSNSGMMLGGVGTGIDLELAAAGNTEVVRSKMKTMKSHITSSGPCRRNSGSSSTSCSTG